ncbi:MAG: hypothetical protein QF622_07615 [Candidatus Marinimicrobia bacterium]|jgi:hypothetical protein|nr:hypothetical protein [Candidatus Neomarinimicrobiota bacterium]HJM34712.1 hypothetical protein [Candidatus Neomarinimicrobiota bacterium]|tara:strand:- start:1015 stop:1875 length:861 start_codon:yes stop_codon:yes gene_type:complete
MKQIILTAFILASLTAQDDFVGETFDRGSINYADRTIQATGIGFIPVNVINAGQARRSAMRIAKQDALRQLIEIVNGVNVTSETTVSGAMFDDVIKTQVQGAIRGARKVGEPKYLSDTSVEVVYEVSMNNISRALLPMAERAPVLSYESVTATGTAAATDAGQGGGAAAAPASGGVTGIIIDGSGLGLRPAMSPRILNQSGTVLYGPGQYDRDYAAANGVVGYAKTLGQAKADTRVQGNPLVLRGASASGTAKTDVIISNADAGKLVSAGRSAGLLQDCRIMFVLN